MLCFLINNNYVSPRRLYGDNGNKMYIWYVYINVIEHGTQHDTHAILQLHEFTNICILILKNMKPNQNDNHHKTPTPFNCLLA